MNLRALILAVGLVAGGATFAYAQDGTETAQPRVLTADAIAAGDNLFRAIVFDGGAVERMFEFMESDVVPSLRRDIISSPIYREATPERREALMLVIDDLPDYMRQEITAGLAEVGTRVAPRFAERMSIEHLNATADFMRSPEMRAQWRNIVETRIEDNKPMPSFPEWRMVGDFAQTPAGQAFAEQQAAFADIMDEESEQTLSLVFPRILATVSGRMCDALGEDCPAYLRDSAGRI